MLVYLPRRFEFGDIVHFLHSRFDNNGFLREGDSVIYEALAKPEIEGICSPELLRSKWVNEDAVVPKLDAVADLAQHHRDHTRILCGSTTRTK